MLLNGDVQLHAWMIPEILVVRREAECGLAYSLEFFDTRAAERAACQFGKSLTGHLPQEAAREASGAAEDVTTTCSSATSGPRYRNDLRLSQVNWADLASGRDKRTTLRLRCLPSALCDEATLQQVLARMQLSKVVDCIRVFPSQGKRPGSALINAVDTAGAAAVAKFFHGRQWGRSMPISVSFAAVQGAAEVQRVFPLADAQETTRAGKAEAEPLRVQLYESSASGQEEHGVSEVSTEAGDDAEPSTMDAAWEGLAGVAMVLQPPWAAALQKTEVVEGAPLKVP